MLFLNSRIRESDVTDGAAHTIFIGEKLLDPDELGWLSGTRATLRNTGTMLNLPLDEALSEAQRSKPEVAPATFVGSFGSHHPGVALFAFGDGTIKVLADTIHEPLYRQLGHRADGQLPLDQDLE